jgi:uncharacterized membrane protein
VDEETQPGTDDRGTSCEHPETASGESFGMDRIKFFSDAVFAIAITLLSLNLILPPGTRTSNLAHQLGTLWPDYGAFAFTFLLIGLRWLTHLIQFRYIRGYDNTLLGLNLTLLLVVAFLPFASRVLADYPYSKAASVLYAGSMAVAGLISTALWWYACRSGQISESLGLDTDTRRELLIRWAVLPGFFVVAIILVFVFRDLWPARAVALCTPVAQIGLAIKSKRAGHPVLSGDFPWRHLAENAHKVFAHDSLHLFLAEAGRLEIVGY